MIVRRVVQQANMPHPEYIDKAQFSCNRNSVLPL